MWFTWDDENGIQFFMTEHDAHSAFRELCFEAGKLGDVDLLNSICWGEVNGAANKDAHMRRVAAREPWNTRSTY